MSSFPRPRRAVRTALGACALSLTLTLAGCGGSSSSTAVPAASSAAPSSAAVPSASAEAPAASSSGAASVAGRNPSSEFCTLARAQTSNDTAKLIAGGTPAEWKAFFDKTEKQNAAILAAAPAEIKDAATVVAKTANGLADEMKRVGYDIKKVDSAKLQSFNTAEIAAAGKTLQDFTVKECGS
jgi:hypothetical protein